MILEMSKITESEEIFSYIDKEFFSKLNRTVNKEVYETLRKYDNWRKSEKMIVVDYSDDIYDDILNMIKEWSSTSGKKYGFIYENEKSKTKEFDKEKFLKWIELAKEKAPENWLTVKQLSEKMNISISQAYILIKDENSGARTFVTNGVMYVDPSRIEKIIAKRGNRYEL